MSNYVVKILQKARYGRREVIVKSERIPVKIKIKASINLQTLPNPGLIDKKSAAPTIFFSGGSRKSLNRVGAN